MGTRAPQLSEMVLVGVYETVDQRVKLVLIKAIDPAIDHQGRVIDAPAPTLAFEPHQEVKDGKLVVVGKFAVPAKPEAEFLEC
jgi:hypothetical protein